MILLFQTTCTGKVERERKWNPGGGGTPYKMDGDARRKF